jgi:AraC-like DNA-binding protein
MLHGQSYRECPPPPALEEHVSCLWVMEVSARSSAYAHLTVPDGSAEIVCELDTAAIRVVGPRTRPRRGVVAPGRTLVGVKFRPGAAQPIIALPASEILDVEVDLDSCWRTRDPGLGESLAEAGSPPHALALLARELVRRAGHQRSPAVGVGDVAVRLQPWRRCTVEALSRELFLSERQLRRRCLAAFGHSPKELQRILRFQAFMALTQGQPRNELELAHLALVVGYADQSHLSRECLRLTGLTPSRFLDDMSSSCGSNHDHAASFAPARRMFGGRGMSDSFKTSGRATS